MPKRFAIRSSRIITSSGIIDGFLIINGEVIERIATKAEFRDSLEIEDFEDLVVMPGIVDTHVHVNEPGRTDWEGYASATRAAAAGGITTIVDMPLNCDPVTTTLRAFEEKLTCLAGKLHVDCGFYAGIVPSNTADITPLAARGVLGFKAFMVDSGLDEFPPCTLQDLDTAMPEIAKTDRPFLVHAELVASSYKAPAIDRSYATFLRSRPPQFEEDAIAALVERVDRYRCRTHVVHLSAASAVPLIRAARQKRLPITAETCPHYLHFAAEQIADGDTRFKCAPPIREGANRDKLWQALADDEIDFVVSDHSPCAPHLKKTEQGSFADAWGGISGLQFGLPVVWTAGQKRNVRITDLAKWLAERPAQMVALGLKKGQLSKGFDADIVIWNPDAEFSLSDDMIFHKHKDTPYSRSRLKGKVEKTYLRGQAIFDSGQHCDAANGKILLRGYA